VCGATGVMDVEAVCGMVRVMDDGAVHDMVEVVDAAWGTTEVVGTVQGETEVSEASDKDVVEGQKVGPPR
jgi:hypothetical protein